MIDRRYWLKLGGLTLGAMATGLPPNLARLLAAQAETSRQPRVGSDDDFSVILFWANGGPSHIDLFDLKPEAPLEYRGPFRPAKTNVPGLEINSQLPRLAKIADKFTLIRSLHHERAEHSGGTHRFLTGYPSRQANLKDAEYPELGSNLVRHLGKRRAGDKPPDVPPFVANTKFYGSGPGYLGPAYAPYMPNPNPLTSTGANQYDPVPIYNSGGAADNLAIDRDGVVTLRRRSNLLETLDALPRALDGGAMSAVDTFQQQALAMLASSRMREAFELQRESERTRARYGDTHWGKSLLTCRRLVEAGVRLVQCQATIRLPAETAVTSNWDDHAVNAHIFDAFEMRMPSLDQSLSALVEDLHDRGLDRRVLLVFCGEFGRTPRIAYKDGRPGRDHWPRAMSVFLSGGGLRMGQVIGATNTKAEEPVERRMDSNCLLATIYHRFGIDTQAANLDLSGRPIPVLGSGSVIAELV